MMASTSAGSGWTTSRIIALAAGSVLLLISLALIAGGGTLAWADTEQLRSGYLTTTTTTYSTSGYALASDPIKPYGAWDWLSLLVDRVRIRISSSDRSRPLFAGIAAVGDVERYLGDSSYTTVGARGEHDVTDHPGTGVPEAPATALHWAAKTQGTGTLSLTWDGQRGHWMAVVMNQDASPGLTVRAEAGMSAPALAWLAGELLALGLLTGVVAGALIVVSVRPALRRRRPAGSGDV
jgi:hypothetical protein